MKRIIVAVATMLLLSTMATAETISYTFIGGGGDKVSDDSLIADIEAGEGYIEASIGVADNFFFGVAGGTGQTRANDIALYNYDGISFAAGAHMPLNDNLDIFGQLTFSSLTYREQIGGLPDETDTAKSGTIGIRYMPHNRVELDAAVDYDFDDSSAAMLLGAQFYATRGLAIGVDYANGDGWSSVGAFGRYYFGR